MYDEPGVLVQPGLHLRGLVRGVVVHHQMQLLTTGVRPIQLTQEREELLVPVLGLQRPGDLPGRDLQSSEERGRAVPLVVMGALSR